MSQHHNRELENWIKQSANEYFSESGLEEKCKDFYDITGPEGRQRMTNIRQMQKDEPELYSDISDVPVTAKLYSSYGPRKMSETVVINLIKKNLVSKKNEKMNGASSRCIDTMIYFCQICDQKGYIENFPIKSLVNKTVDSKRGAYFVLDKLEKKGFIKVETICKNGLRNITVLHNDFSDRTKKYRYLNLNRECFNMNIQIPEDPRGYAKFKKTSLFAKKLMLYILFQCDATHSKYGYRGGSIKLAKQLGINNHKLILQYINEITPMCLNMRDVLFSNEKSSIYTYRSKETGSNDTIVCVKKNKLAAENGFIKTAPSALKYQIENIFARRDIEIENADMLKNKICDELSGLIIWNSVRFKKSPLQVEDIVKIFDHFICTLDKFMYEHIEIFNIFITEVVRRSCSAAPTNLAVAWK